jgi:hypothetical protein
MSLSMRATDVTLSDTRPVRMPCQYEKGKGSVNTEYLRA